MIKDIKLNIRLVMDIYEFLGNDCKSPYMRTYILEQLEEKFDKIQARIDYTKKIQKLREDVNSQG